MAAHASFFDRHSHLQPSEIHAMIRGFPSPIRAVFSFAAFFVALPWIRADDGDWQQWSEVSATQTFGYGLDGILLHHHASHGA